MGAQRLSWAPMVKLEHTKEKPRDPRRTPASKFATGTKAAGGRSTESASVSNSRGGNTPPGGDTGGDQAAR